MKAIIVDDEWLSLIRLEKMLSKLNIDVIGAYIKPFEAHEMIKKLQPDVVFLDIEMPDLDGLTLGEQIQQSYPEIKIVFVTAYNQYAVNAFDLYAIDYIMKPVQKQRLHKTIHRLIDKLEISQQGAMTNNLKLNLFKKMSAMTTEGEVIALKWRTAKAQELFAYLLHHQGQMIYCDMLIELLWANFDDDRAAKQLYTTIYHIRQTLKKYNLQTVKITKQTLDKGYRLELGELDINTEKWAERVKYLPPLKLETLAEYERLFYEYEGDYLGEYEYIWAEGERERLRRLFFQLILHLNEFYVDNGQVNPAIKMYERLQKLYPYEESSYFHLMKLFSQLGNKIAVEEQYVRLLNICKEQLDTEISEEVASWYKDWKQ